MPELSFRWLVSQVVPRLNPRKRAILGLGVLILAGCGGGGGETRERVVRGPGFAFSAPADWTVSRSGRDVRASKGLNIVSVARFALVRSFRPELWPRVVKELDRAAEAVARQQGGEVGDPRTVTIAGARARRYDIAYERDGKQLVQRIAFFLRGRTEYLLLCRYARGGETRACDGLLATFKLT